MINISASLIAMRFHQMRKITFIVIQKLSHDNHQSIVNIAAKSRRACISNSLIRYARKEKDTTMARVHGIARKINATENAVAKPVMQASYNPRYRGEISAKSNRYTFYHFSATTQYVFLSFLSFFSSPHSR